MCGIECTVETQQKVRKMSIPSNWLVQASIAAVCLVPTWLAVGFFKRNYAVQADVFVVWYFAGVIAATAIVSASNGSPLLPRVSVVAGMIFVGLTLGSVSNILAFRSVASAPNPGMALAIIQTANVGVLFAAVYLGRAVPSYFDAEKIDWVSILGTVLVTVGVMLIVARR